MSSERVLRRKRPSRVAGAKIQESGRFGTDPGRAARVGIPAGGEMQWGVSGAEDTAVTSPWVTPPSLP